MKINNCRVCGRKFLGKPLLEYKNMPMGAQHLPAKECLEKDKGVTIRVCQCSGCGLIQLDNPPVSYYKEVIRAAGVSEEMKNFRIRQFEDFLEKYQLSGKKIIEIGCGRGEYLTLMQKAGAVAYGIEYSPKAVEHCARKGLKVYGGFIGENKDLLKDSPFDAFFILNFLEHLPDINRVLKGIYDNLKEDALGLVEVPNFEMIIKKKLFAEFAVDHLYYFTKDTLETALTINGFEIVSLSFIWHNYILSAVVRKKKRMDFSDLGEQKDRIKKRIVEFTGRFKKLAVWGAGHQALAIMSIVNLKNKIKYVVDLSPIKQGRYTSGAHFPIVPPETLCSEPVEAIIIMAASYSDEVADNIKKMECYKKMKVVILRDYGLEILN